MGEKKISPSADHSLQARPTDADVARANRLAKLQRFTMRTGLVRYSGQKLNETARLLKGLTLPAALVQMQFHDRKGAKLACLPLLRHAINHVQQRHGQPQDFVVEQALVGRGDYKKKLDIKGRGRHGVMRRPSCFLRLVVARPQPVAGMKRMLLRSVNRAVRRHPREDKPAYPRMLY